MVNMINGEILKHLEKLPSSDIYESLGTTLQGLTTDEAIKRKAE